MKSFIVSISQIEQFRQKLLKWYRKEGRALPWRQTHNPYHIWLSEVMLQQTQVDRVKERYVRWLKRFPTLEHLATAPTTEVLQEWSGLGYNRRALALQASAKQIVKEYHGAFPNTLEDLMKLKGIGKYTASAILAFAFKKPVPIVDTNVKRVLGRIFFGYKQLAQLIDTDEPFWELKQKIIDVVDTPRRGVSTVYDFNQGIMDFGAIICQARRPKCEVCPLKSLCKSYPDILTAKKDLLRVKRQRTEPLYFGKPRRIWRGKILKLLHEQKKIEIKKLGKTLMSDWEENRLVWLQEVLQTMIKDGLIVAKKNKVGLP